VNLIECSAKSYRESNFSKEIRDSLERAALS
jgi:hypothetical protein